MTRVLITGGAGFIGSALVRYVLADAAFDGVVLNVDKLTYAANLDNVASVAGDPRYRFAQIDIADLDAVQRIMHEFGPDLVIHLAAETHVDRSIDSPFAFVETNVLGTCNLLHAALAEARKRPGFRFVHVSTDEVYGSMPDGRSAVEGDPYRPNSPYSASKAASDHMVRAWHVTYELPVILTNCTNNYGPCQFPEKLIPVMTLNAVTGRSLPVYGDGGNVRDWLHVDDHARAIWLAANHGDVGGNYNVSSGEEKTNLEVVRAICAALDECRPLPDGRSYADQICFVTDRPGHDRRYSLDSTRIRTELGWSPAYAFEAGIRSTVEWFAARADSLTRDTDSAYTERRGLVS